MVIDHLFLFIVMNIFIVIPVYNEEEHILNVIKEVSEKKFPIVVVDDGSYDNSNLKIQKSNLKTKKVTLLTHKVNLGKGAAMKTGAEYAFSQGADAVIFMDSDGQHLVQDLDGFIKAIKQHDFVVGTRNLGYGVPLFRYIGNKLASLLVSFLFGKYISDILCGYRAITKNAYRQIAWRSKGYGVETEMIVKAAVSKLKFQEVPVTVKYYDKHKGVTIFDAVNILFDVILWRIELWFAPILRRF